MNIIIDDIKDIGKYHTLSFEGFEKIILTEKSVLIL